MTSDAIERARALDPEHSFICEAPAGSGKTELLTQRVLTLLARVSVPEAVLAITFTRKAAAEMQARVLEALHSAQGPQPEDSHKRTTWQLARKVLSQDAAYGWCLMGSPSRLQIKTFDGLARELTQKLPLQVELDSQWQPSENPDELYREAVQELLDTVEQNVTWAESLKVLFAHLDNGYSKLEQLLISMLQNRDSWMHLLGVARLDSARPLLEGFLHTALADKVQAIGEALQRAQADNQVSAKELRRLAVFAGANMKAEKPSSPLALLEQLPPDEWPGADNDGWEMWQALAGLVLTTTGAVRKTVDKRCGFPVGEGADKQRFKENKTRMVALLAQLGADQNLCELIQEIPNWPTVNFTPEQWPVLEALTEILPIALGHLHLVFQRRQQLDFTEISQRARRALGEEGSPTDLALRLDYQIQHILVDEFQDTSFTQVDLLKKLTAGWQPDDGRTLFCVGDAMQSIYSFRAANVGLFLHCKYAGLGEVSLEPLQLTANFRSRAGVVEWVNRSFARAFPAEVDITTGAVPFAEAEPFRAASESRAVTTHIFDPADDSAPASWLVEELQSIWQSNPETRVGVLVRSRSHANEIVRACELGGIRYRAVEMVPLRQRAAMQDLFSLTAALLNPADRVAWLSVLRAPWCGLTLADLTRLSRCGGGQNLTVIQQMAMALEQAALEPDGHERLARVYPLLEQALQQRARKALVSWVEGVWHALGGHCLLAEAADEQNVQQYWQMLSALEASGQGVDKAVVEHALDKLYAAPDPHADGRLQIMTIHKSKGLEFDVVFLPQLHRRSRAEDSELLLWQERLSHSGEDTLLIAPVGATGQEKDPVYRHLSSEKKKRLRLEACRLLYVACTRARERLYLMASLDQGTEDERFKAPGEGSLLHYIWPTVSVTAEAMPVTAAAQDVPDAPPSVASPLLRVAEHWQPPPRSEQHILSAFVPHHDYENEQSPEFLAFDIATEVPRFVGTVVHQSAQWLAEGGLPALAALDLPAMRPLWRARLLEAGVPPQLLAGALEDVARAVRALVNHEKFRWQLEQPWLACEYPVHLSTASGVREYVMDVVLTTAQGHTWVIDYKTSSPAQGQSSADFIAAQVQAYSAIMNQYRRAMQKLGHKHVKCALFFVVDGLWVELD